MERPSPRDRSSTVRAAVLGGVAGLVVVAFYLGAGLLVAGWNVTGFLARISAGTVGYLLGMIALATAFVGVPIATFLRLRLVAPLVVLGLVVLGWLALGAVRGILSLDTIFGLALYVAYLSPVALGLYAILGGGEYVFRAASGENRADRERAG